MSIPPTERDPESRAVPPTVRLPVPRRRRRWPWVLALLLVALAGAGAYLYKSVLRPPATAHRHVPAGTSIALYADALKILLWKPVREHLWPLAFESEEGKDPAESERAARIHEKTGVRVPADFREVIVASVDGTSWVAIVGGAIEPGRFVTGLHEVLKEEGVEGWRLEDDLLLHERGVAIAQADDGTLLIGTDATVVRAALPASDEEDALPALPRREALGFVVEARAYRAAVGMVPLDIPGLDALSKIDSLSGTVTLDDEPRLTLRAKPRDGVDAAALGEDLDTLLSRLRLALLLVSTDLYGAKQAIGDAQVRTDGGAVLVQAPWSYEALDRGVRRLADTVRARRSASP